MADLQTVLAKVDALSDSELKILQAHILKLQAKQAAVNEILAQCVPEDSEDIKFIDEVIAEVRREHSTKSVTFPS